MPTLAVITAANDALKTAISNAADRSREMILIRNTMLVERWT
ncbi:MAG: hypothetical protein ACR2NX_05965 [Chthoniobacterales bacterium]